MHESSPPVIRKAGCSLYCLYPSSMEDLCNKFCDRAHSQKLIIVCDRFPIALEYVSAAHHPQNSNLS
ncbi:MAG TPA: hypothetical protein V6C95_07720 [Coleofasciculaceae cyanobacterium]